MLHDSPLPPVEFRMCYNLKLALSNQVRTSNMSQPIKIGTHNGVFHCDEALACFMLRLLPQYKDAEIVRSRNYDILEPCDILVDVGRVYDHSLCRYDHHMREFNESLSTLIRKPGYDSTVKLSSAGLIYCHYGHKILKHIIPECTSDEHIECIFKKVYDTFIKEIDGIDNGVPMYDGEPVYKIVTDISSRVDYLNPSHNNPEMNPDVQFRKAMELVGGEFVEYVKRSFHVWLPGRSLIQSAVDKRFEVHASGEIILLDECVSWQEHLFNIEKEQSIEPLIKYVIFKADDSYRVRAVPVAPGSFICRLFLPEPWAGLRDEELQKVSGIDDGVFVHSVRFIGGHKNLKGAILMGSKSLEIGKIK